MPSVSIPFFWKHNFDPFLELVTINSIFGFTSNFKSFRGASLGIMLTENLFDHLISILYVLNKPRVWLYKLS